MRERQGRTLILRNRGREFVFLSCKEARRKMGHWVALLVYKGVPRPGWEFEWVNKKDL